MHRFRLGNRIRLPIASVQSILCDQGAVRKPCPPAVACTDFWEFEGDGYILEVALSPGSLPIDISALEKEPELPEWVLRLDFPKDPDATFVSFQMAVCGSKAGVEILIAIADTLSKMSRDGVWTEVQEALKFDMLSPGGAEEIRSVLANRRRVLAGHCGLTDLPPKAVRADSRECDEYFENLKG